VPRVVDFISSFSKRPQDKATAGEA
jgi:hypothetical protein